MLSIESHLTDATTACEAASLFAGGLKLNPRQQRRLAWLTARKGRPVVWNGEPCVPDRSRLVIVVRAPTGPQVERFRYELAADVVVVIPYGEDPAFDALKSCLVGFGTVGAAGAQGPHQMWWGGREWGFLVPPTELVSPSIVPSPVPQAASDEPAIPLRPRHRSRQPDRPVVNVAAQPDDDMAGKADLVLALWQTKDHPLLWLDPGTQVILEPLLPSTTECDFAIVKRDRWQFDTRTMYFSRTAAAEALLRTWVDFCRCYPALGEDYLLDQAWSLVTSQLGLDTVWLPPSYGAAEEPSRPSACVIVHPAPMDTGGFHTTDLISDLSRLVRLKAARRAERTGGPEVLIPAACPAAIDTRVVVIVRDIGSVGSDRTAAMLEGIAESFHSDPAGFSQLEIILCRWQDELNAALAATRNEQVIVATPTDGFAPDAFRQRAADRPREAGHGTTCSPDGPSRDDSRFARPTIRLVPTVI